MGFLLRRRWMVNCKECQTAFETNEDLHRHLRSHKLKIEDYYHKHFDRRDLLTGELIKYKSYEQYFTQNFNSRENFKKWYASQPQHVLKEYALNFLKARIQVKGLLYAPSQVELRTLYCPSIFGYNLLFGDYYRLCYDLGLRVRFEKPDPFTLINPQKPLFSNIVIDSREQTPLKFDCEAHIGTLNVGDYGFLVNGKPIDLVFERKSLTDFINSFGRDFERVHKEFERARIAGFRVIVIVECGFGLAFQFDKLPQCKFSSVKPDFIFHNVRHILRDFHNVQFLFVNNRETASQIITKIFYSEGEFFKYDLQFLYDTNTFSLT